MNKIIKIIVQAIPVLLMIALIPLIKNDYLLSLVFIIIIVVSFLIRHEKRDYLFLIFGFIVMTIFEYIFIKAGVESFNRNSLFGVMPLWLPFLWAYAFIAIKRAIDILR